MRAQRKIISPAVADRWEPVADSPTEQIVPRADIALVWQVAPRALGVLALIALALFAGRALLDTPSPSADARTTIATPALSGQPVRAGFSANPPADPPELTALSYTPEPLARSEAAADASGSSIASENPNAGAAPAQEAVVAATPALARAEPTEASVSTSPAPAARQPDQAGFVWPEAAVNCPRTWIDDPNAGPAPAGDTCHEYAALPQSEPSPELEAAAEAEVPAAASSLLSETAPGEASAGTAPIEFARLPIARPANPPQSLTKAVANRPARARRGSSSWPSDPPPNCGSKRARWRYTDRKQGTKVWFCK